MKRQIILGDIPAEYRRVSEALANSWVLDPDIYDGKPCRLDHAIVYHLVLYEGEEEKPVEQKELERKVISIQSVDINDADRLLKAGYEIQATYAKTVTLVLYEDLNGIAKEVP